MLKNSTHLELPGEPARAAGRAARGGTAAYWWQGGNFHWLPVAVVGPPTILGGWLGARWTGQFRKESLVRLVGWTVLLTGLGMAGQGAWKALAAAWV